MCISFVGVHTLDCVESIWLEFCLMQGAGNPRTLPLATSTSLSMQNIR